jgi:hypothetical protein
MILLLYGYMRLRVLLVALVILFPSAVATAQFDAAQFSETPQIAITLNPSNPSPGDLVTASLDDYAGGVYGSEITWRYDGEVVPGAVNQRQIQFVAGDAGTDTTVEATLALPIGGTQTLQAIVSPVYMDIIIEPQTRVPDWYAGRALPSLGSQINATVLLNDGSFIDPQSVVYTWRVNNKVIEGGPIRAGNKVAFPTPRGGGVTVSVTATKSTGETIASRAVSVGIVLPELSFYEKHTLYGMKSSPVTATTPLVGSILTLQAEPFFLDSRVYNNPDVAQWEINSVRTDNGSNNPYEITLRSTGQNGRMNVNFHVRSLQEILQGSEASVAINF